MKLFKILFACILFSMASNSISAINEKSLVKLESTNYSTSIKNAPVNFGLELECKIISFYPTPVFECKWIAV